MHVTGQIFLNRSLIGLELRLVSREGAPKSDVSQLFTSTLVTRRPLADVTPCYQTFSTLSDHFFAAGSNFKPITFKIAKDLLKCFRFSLFTGSGWRQEISAPIGKYPERHFGNEAAIAHGRILRHKSKDPQYVAQLGVSNGVKGSGNPYIDQGQSTLNETVLLGKQIILRCHIEDVGNQSVRISVFTQSYMIAWPHFLFKRDS